ncbi:hypothetical protein ACOMHN_062022 [Nucella lapillus]
MSEMDSNSMDVDDSMDEHDDPVVHEVDVYLSKTLESNLYVLQYPQRHAKFPISGTSCTHAKVKPKQKVVEIGLARNTHPTRYFMSRGVQYASSAGADNVDEEQPHFRSDILDTEILRSVASPSEMNKYAVAVLKDDEVHLTPLHAFVQLHETLEYLDKAKSKAKSDADAREGAAAGDSSQDEDEAEAVTVRFAPQESAEAKARRLGSSEYMYRQTQEERWCPLTYNGQNDRLTVEHKFQQLYASRSQDKRQQFWNSAEEYLTAMVPDRDSDHIVKTEMPDSVLTRQRLKQMPLAESVKAVLMSAKVMKFSLVMEMLPEGTDPVATLRVLQQVAVMVQGCWVIKSDVLYPSDACSSYSGIAAEHLIRGRDFVMWKFTHCRYVVRREIAAALPSEDMKEILEQMSTFRSSKGWEFVFDYDREFVDRHPEVVQRQRLLWDSKYQVLCQYFKLPKDADKKAREAELILMMQNVERPRRRRASSRSSPRKRTLSGRSDDSHTETDAAGDRHHAGGMNHADGAEFMEISGHDNLSSDYATQKKPLNGSVRTLDFGDANDITSDSSELRKALVEIAREVMLKIPVLKFSILKHHYLMSRDLMPQGHPLATKVVSDRMLKEAVLAAGGVQVNKPMASQPDADSLFVYLHQGNKFDKARGVLLSLFEQSNKVKSTTFFSRVRESGEDGPTEAELKKLIRELCESQKGMWYLKGTGPRS